LKENNFEHTWGNVTVKLANSYGFCWGVERAVQIAYEARKQFPEQKLWLTNEIIHNPTVNQVGTLALQPHLIPLQEKHAFNMGPMHPTMSDGFLHVYLQSAVLSLADIITNSDELAWVAWSRSWLIWELESYLLLRKGRTSQLWIKAMSLFFRRLELLFRRCRHWTRRRCKLWTRPALGCLR
jgi:hypothetical protein